MSGSASEFGSRYARLIEVISGCSTVLKLDRPNEPEASTLAHAFLDLEESFKRFVDVHLPQLTKSDLSEQQICDCLHDIGEEFRHILYHIHDPQLYRHLFAGADLNQD